MNNTFEEILIGQSPEFLAVTRAADVVAASDVTVLILGESGTGKELLAQAMHQRSRRAGRPYITVNCAALPEALAESELFGHRKGAFTGASSDYGGRIRAAAGGTLLLDEVGELSLPIQAKLLRFLESGECQAVGEPCAGRVDVRVLAATNRDLYAEVKAGRFREDLYYRLHVVPMELPALRERTGDIELLLQRLTERLAAQHELDAPRYSRRALACLQRYRWPGNVRELRNFCERMVVLFPGREVEAENLPQEIRNGREVVPEGGLFAIPEDGISLEEVEQHLIRQALVKTSGNRSKAARLLGLTRDTLLYRIKKYAIQA